MYDFSFHALDSRVKYKEMQVYPTSIYSQISIIETKKIRMPVMRISFLFILLSLQAIHKLPRRFSIIFFKDLPKIFRVAKSGKLGYFRHRILLAYQ